MKTEKEIEEMARRVFNTHICQEWLKWQDSNTVEGLKLLAIDIAKQAQKDLLAEASEGFEEWWERKSPKWESDKPYYLESWQASRFPLMKKIEELRSVIKIKDEFMQASVCLGKFEEVQKENEELREALDWATSEISVAFEKEAQEIRTKFSLDKSDKGAV